MEILIVLFAIAGLGYLVIKHVNRIQSERDALAARQTYEHISGPIIVTSNFPNDQTVLMRAQAWRENLRAAGNKYSEQIPIVPYPFALGASPDLGVLTTWRQYRVNCLMKERELFADWDAQMAKQNAPLHDQFILGQEKAN